MVDLQAENVEIQLLLEAIYQRYGYDFRSYSQASVKRRIQRRMHFDGIQNISEMQHRVLHDHEFFEQLLLDLSINVTEMFRDPAFFRGMREHVVPELARLPFFRVWHAGCSTGEEVYSMAILLEEAGLYDRCQIYATDFNEVVLRQAREGIMPLSSLRDYTANYQKAGGTESFADYYTARYDSAIIRQSLKRNIVFADHNLVTDGAFGEMHLVVCRNVLIYFSRPLQNRVLALFSDSLADDGFLCIGTKETVQFADCSEDFVPVVASERIYRRRPRAMVGEAQRKAAS